MTAVEWLANIINNNSWNYMTIREQKKIIIQALEMEKHQRKDAFIEGHNVCRCVTDNTDKAKECFEEWFKQGYTKYDAFIAGAEWQTERMFSLDEIKDAMKNGYGIKYFSEDKFLKNLNNLKKITNETERNT